MTEWTRRGLVFAAALLLAASTSAMPGPGVAMRGLVFRTKTLDLPSGMRIVVEEDRSQPLVAIVAVVDVGSSQDPAGKEGLAHLVEHLTFRTKPDGKIQRASLFDFGGAGYWNASTTHDLTTYLTIGPTEALLPLLTLEGRRLLAPLAGLDARGFEVEQGVVRNEITQRDEQGAVSAVGSRLYGVLYPQGHPYHRAVGGSEASISALTLADAQTFVQQHYLPRNITLYVSGDVDLDTIEKVFDASLPREFLDAPASGPVAPQRRLGDTPPPVPALAAAGRLEVLRAPTERPTLYIAWSLPAGYGAQGYLERFTRSVLTTASFGAATLGSDIEALGTSLNEGRYGNTLICEVVLKEGQDPEKSLERILDQTVKIWLPGTSVREIESANRGFANLQKAAIVRVALRTESILARAEEKAVLIHWTGDPLAWGKDMRAMFELNAGKLESFAYDWLSRDRARAIFVQPTGDRSAALDFAGTPSVFAAPDDVRVKIAPEALSTYVHGPAKDLHALVLKNGLEVLLVKRASAPTVAVTLGVRGGRATSEPKGAAELATTIASPTQKFNGPPAKYGARLSLETTLDSTYYTGLAASGNLENVLAMMADGVKSMHVDDGMRAGWKELVNHYRRHDALPSTQLDRAFQEETFIGSPLGRSVTADDIDRLSPGDVQTWIDRSLRPQDAAMAVVGDIDLVEAEKQIRDWFDGWDGRQDPRAEAHETAAPEKDGPVSVVRVDRPGMKQTEIRLGCAVPEPNQLERIALRLLGARIRGRLYSLARSSLGGSYGFSGGAALYRQTSTLSIAGLVDDRSLNRVLAVARKEMDELGTTKLTEDELGLLKWRQGLAANLRYTTNASLGRALVSARLADLTVDSIAKYPELLAAVTVDDMARVAATCHKTAVVFLSGDPDVVTKALQATAR